MNSNLTLTNSSQFNIADEEILLRSIPSKIKIGDLSTDALRLLVYYVSKAGPFELAVDSGYFEGTLEEWLQSMKSTLQFKASVETYADLANLEGLVAGDVVFVRFTSLAYIYDGEAFAAEPEGISISGPSAYDIAVQNGFVGTVPEWLDSLKGEVGDEGEQGLKGDKGDKGDTGLSAYELATADVVDAPTLEEWLLSLKGADGLKGDTGADGENGTDGKSAFEVAVGNGFEGTELEWLASLKGEDGINGTDGKDAYEVFIQVHGPNLIPPFPTYEQWLDSLKGEKGDAFTYSDFTAEQLEALKGPKGEDGVDGLDGKAFTYEDFTPTQLEGLKGEPGNNGEKGDAFTYADFTPEQLEGLKGPKGDQGEPGPKGEDGVDGIDGVTQDATTIVLTGLDTSDATAAVETDTLLIVIGKLQAQINSLTARLEALETQPEV